MTQGTIMCSFPALLTHTQSCGLQCHHKNDDTSRPFPRRTLTNCGGEWGQVAHSHHTSVWPHPSEEGRLGASRQRLDQANAGCLRGTLASWRVDNHKGSGTVKTTGAVSRWAGKSIAGVYWLGLNTNFSLASYSWFCQCVQTLLDEVKCNADVIVR